ncbi:MAG: hypothetical protein KPI85_05510 [cyanobacterium endosymbiont of Epithemia adnata isolate EadnSB Bon19]|uniref:hypothetical protein n=1 Tax=cyanobacterium endosymbiont of Epithemia turgida TaxID=718217 RepID=UPI0004D1F530|nr:hypothetical protein [cyanobacterium endosymbiont of Epithemia turgida]BAP17148.1 hypothetical protein ETSB_0271 [cyanobacterium endosymbiont of Epithemia turgida isolate EtSB Lake Yunoko]
MLSTSTNKAAMIRNYILLSLVVMILGVGLTDIFKNPGRVGQKDRIDNYVRYINAGFVAQTQKSGR